MIPTETKSLKLISYTLVFLILFQSCTVYEHSSTTLENAVIKEKRKGVIVTKEDIVLKYLVIEEMTDFYYGIVKLTPEPVKIKIPKERIDQIQMFFKLKVVYTDSTIRKFSGIILQGDKLFGITQTDPEISKVLLEKDKIENIYLVDKGKSKGASAGISGIIITSLLIVLFIYSVNTMGGFHL
jgi:hypothetical protein